MSLPQVKESYLWSQVKSGLDYPDVHMSRIENTAGTGISDVSACCNGVEVWLELKVFHGSRIHFRNSQRIWILRRLEVGGKVLIIARKDDTLYIYGARETLSCASRPESNGRSFSILQQDLPAPIFECHKPFKWQQIKDIIFGTTWSNVSVSAA